MTHIAFTPEGMSPSVKPSRTLLFRALAFVALVLLVWIFHDRMPSWHEIWETIQGVHPGWLVAAVIAQATSMAMFARLLRRLVNSGGAHLTMPRAVAVTYARNAVSNSLPAGPALSVAYSLRQFGKFGVPAKLTAATLVLSTLFSVATFGVLTAAVLLVTPETRLATGVIIGVLIVVAVAAIGIQRIWPTIFSKPNAHTPHHPQPVDQTRKATNHAQYGRIRRQYIQAQYWIRQAVSQLKAGWNAIQLTRRDKVALVALALANWLLDIACLGVVAIGTDLDVAPHTIVLGYVAAKTAGTMALLPGGLGAVEVGMAATFLAAGAGGIPVAATIALYRLIAFWAVVAAGWLTWLGLLGRRPELRDAELTA